MSIPLYTESPNIPLQNSRWYPVFQRLPAPVKRYLLARYWALKAFKEDFQDYAAELIGYVPSHPLRLFGYRILCQVKLGRDTSIHRRCRLYHPFRVQIGDNTVINYGVLLDGRRGLKIGNNVSISEGSVILTLGHDIDDPDFGLKGGQVTVANHVFVGSHALILPGITIGEGAAVAAGAVVTRDVAPYTVVGGVPAHYLRDRSRDLRYRLNHRKRFG